MCIARETGPEALLIGPQAHGEKSLAGRIAVELQVARHFRRRSSHELGFARPGIETYEFRNIDVFARDGSRVPRSRVLISDDEDLFAARVEARNATQRPTCILELANDNPI